MSKHTPGPWYIGDEYCKSMDEIASASSGGRTVAVVWTRRASEFATARQQFKPDAEMTAESAHTWTSSAGPRQTKAVDEAIRALRSRGKSRIEINGVVGGEEFRSVIVGGLVAGEINPAAVEAEREIGERFGWTVTADNCREIAAAFQAAAAALVLPVTDLRRSMAEERARMEAQTERDRVREEEQKRINAAGERMRALAPPWAAAAIIAEEQVDQSDSMTDYFAHQTTRYVLIGWRKGKREDFRQLRAAAAQFPETAHLGPGCDEYRLCGAEGRYLDADGGPAYCGGAEVYPTEAAARAAAERLGLTDYTIDQESVEQRENWSMGGGNYLKAGSRHGSGWAVRSYDLQFLTSREIEIALPAPVTPAAAEATAGEATPGGTGANGAAWSINTEKGGVEIRFPAKPAAAILERIKAQGFRWSRFSGCWWIKDTPAARATAEAICGPSAETVPVATAGPEKANVTMSDTVSHRPPEAVPAAAPAVRRDYGASPCIDGTKEE